MDDYYKTKETVQEYIKMAEGHSGANLISKIEAYLPKNSRVLELGSGPGTDWQILNQDFQITGSDNSQEFIKHLTAKFPEGEFLQLNASTINTSELFDAVYSNKVLHHLTDAELQQSIQRQYDILALNGLMCHSFWNGDGNETFKGMFVNYHNEKAIRKLLDGKFEIILMDFYKEFDEEDSLFVIGRKV